MSKMPHLFTCSFGEFRPSMGVPVRTSNGHPRWRLNYKVEHVCRDLMPEREWMDLPAADFDTRYTTRLEQIGVAELSTQFDAIASAANHDNLVLLCFESLAKRDACHRRTFAEWWTVQTGQTVPELGQAASEQLSLQNVEREASA